MDLVNILAKLPKSLEVLRLEYAHNYPGYISDAELFYLDYFNNFITVSAMADYYYLTIDEVNSVINEGRKAHEKRV